MPLSILSVAYPFAAVAPDTVGGAEQILCRLDRGLVAHGDHSTVIAMAGSRVAGRLLPIPAPRGVIDQDARARAHDAVRSWIAQLIAQERPHLIHMHGVDFASYLPPQDVPVLVTLHMPLERYPPGALQPGGADLWLLPVSSSQARTASPEHRLLPPIENGVALAPPTRQIHRRHLLAMGRVCPEKNFAAALDAARLAGWPLLLAGQVHPYLEHLRYFDTEIRPRLSLERRWLGPVAGQRKQRLLSGARCLLVPSLIPETSCLVAMEALAAGTPVIGYRCGALPEVIEHGRTGFIVDDVPSMVEAIHAAGSIDPKACRGAARERFPLSRMITQYLSLYERLAAGRGPRPRQRRAAGAA